MRTLKNMMMVLMALTAVCTGCKKDEFTKSIFIDPVVDPSSPTYKFDNYLQKRFVEKYNVEIIYRWKDNTMSASYNLVPVSMMRADTIAHLCHYLWFDVYDKCVSTDFLNIYGPRMIQFVGSKGYMSNGTAKLGTAEGGIKILLYGMNEMDITSAADMNQYAFHVMHHEFSHILHQTKTYPKEYEAISMGKYDSDQWQNNKDSVVHRLGFVTCYASSQPREDFVETISTYVTDFGSWKTWNEILEDAAKGGPEPGVTGKDILLRKLELCRTWLREKYEIDIDNLRSEVMKRQSSLNMDSIMNELYLPEDVRIAHDWDFAHPNK